LHRHDEREEGRGKEEGKREEELLRRNQPFT